MSAIDDNLDTNIDSPVNSKHNDNQATDPSHNEITALDENKVDDYSDNDFDDNELYDLACISLSSDNPIQSMLNNTVDEDIFHYCDYTTNKNDALDSNIDHYAMTSIARNSDRIPRNYTEAMRLPDAKEYHEATIKEFKQLKDRKVFDIVPLPPGKKAISTKILYKKKYRLTGKVKKYKARCVAQGFLQKKEQDYNEL